MSSPTDVAIDDDLWLTSALLRDQVDHIVEDGLGSELLPRVLLSGNSDSLVTNNDPCSPPASIPDTVFASQPPSPSIHDTDGEYELEEDTANIPGTSNDNDSEPSIDQPTPTDQLTSEDDDDTSLQSSDSENWTKFEGEETDDDDDDETKENFESRLIYWIAQMMFVSGETAEPSPETTWMIEEIVREQVLEMVSSQFSSQEAFLTDLAKNSSNKPLYSPIVAVQGPSQLWT